MNRFVHSTDDHSRGPAAPEPTGAGGAGDADLAKLVALGTSLGYLTFDQVNEYLPDEAVDP